MPRTRSIAWAELRVGIISIIALVVLVAVVFAVGGETGFFWQRYPLRARFTDAKGLKAGAVVRLNGKEIGTVTAVDFAGAAIEVKLDVVDDVRPLVTTESTASIGALSLLGEPIVDIHSVPGGRPLRDNEEIKTATAAGFDELSATASTGLEQLSGLLTDIRAGKGTLGKLITDEALYNQMQAFVSAAAQVTQSLNQGQGTLGGLLKDPAAYNSLRASLDNLQTLTARINAGQGPLGRLVNDDAMGKSLANTTANLDQITGRMSRGEGTAGKLLTDQQLYDRLNSMATRVDTLMSNLDAGQGTAGQLLHDRQLYDNMNRAVSELQGLLADIRRDPKKYLRLNISIF